jgi:hypothetical protein
VDTAEVVIGEVQSDSGSQVLPFFRERIREPSQTANLHSHGEVLAFDVRSANPLVIRHPGAWDYLHVTSAGEYRCSPSLEAA